MSERFAALAAVLLVIAIAASGCSQFVPSEPRPTSQVTRQQAEPSQFPTIAPRFGPPGATWYLVSLKRDDATVSVLANTTVTAVFDGRGNVTGTAGCNDYRAPYSGNLSVGTPALASGRRCDAPAGVMEQETAYLAALARTRGYEVDQFLRLLDERGAVQLTFAPVPAGESVPARLIGTTWYVTSFATPNGTAYSPRGLTTISLVFGEDGALYGNAGCNYLYAPYRLAGGEALSIGSLRTTRIHCGIAGVMDLEQEFLALLPLMTRYSITGDALSLTDAEGKVRISCDTRLPS